MSKKLFEEITKRVNEMKEEEAKDLLATLFAILASEGYCGKSNKQVFEEIKSIFEKTIAYPYLSTIHESSDASDV
ncbi:hypothetical protein LSG31_18200 [Fodinisporobacter ferrooxydans]|uniref:Uncharacterized protein n=1 Tax=Fodinisporobacter ferrooxydans TaxID=2901836 RepID=A0ABY4CGZ7_9BACL|nr:hypothetical protein LSG31_18200 [Alicyclobacillaceae bacterium MYW30-H2]